MENNELKIENGLYLTKITYYNENTDEEEIKYAFVIANGYGDAATKIAKDFCYIKNLSIDEIQPNAVYDINCIYIPDDPYIIQKVREENEF